MGLCSVNLSFIIALLPSQPPSQLYDTSQHFSELGAARFFSQKSISHILQPDAYFVNTVYSSSRNLETDGSTSVS